MIHQNIGKFVTQSKLEVKDAASRTKNGIKFVLFLSILAIFCSSNVSQANSRFGPLRSFGDAMQIVNPVIATVIASQEKGAGHFAIIYGQTFVIMHGTKLIAKSGKWSISKRPHIEGKKDRFEGLPSGHTASAWSAAAYVRTFSEDYKMLSIPLYITAAATGYSRIHSKEHTTTQVVAGAILAEAVTYVNSKLDWSNEYRSANFSFNEKGGTASFVFKF
jgi:membrane-associated phospholipid phosphatase